MSEERMKYGDEITPEEVERDRADVDRLREAFNTGPPEITRLKAEKERAERWADDWRKEYYALKDDNEELLLQLKDKTKWYHDLKTRIAELEGAIEAQRVAMKALNKHHRDRYMKLDKLIHNSAWHVQQLSDRDRYRDALEASVAIGHNPDCMFCGFKDKRATEALKEE